MWVRKIIRQTNARRLPARSARVRSSKQCSAQWTLYQTSYAHSVANQNIPLNAAELTRKLKRRLEPRNQELPEATHWTRQWPLLNRPGPFLLQPLYNRIPLLRTTTCWSGAPTDNRWKTSTTGIISWRSCHVIPIWRNTTPRIHGRRQNGPWQSLLYSRISPLHSYFCPWYVWLHQWWRNSINFFKFITGVTHVTTQ